MAEEAERHRIFAKAEPGPWSVMKDRLWLPPGLYAARFHLKSAEVALKIVYEPTRDPLTGELLDRSWYWSCMVNGKRVFDASPIPPSPLLQHQGIPFRAVRAIEQWEYDLLVKDRAWARAHEPGSPEAEPTVKVDLEKMKPVF